MGDFGRFGRFQLSSRDSLETRDHSRRQQFRQQSLSLANPKYSVCPEISSCCWPEYPQISCPCLLLAMKLAQIFHQFCSPFLLSWFAPSPVLDSGFNGGFGG
jgi:hypothetical protein